MPQPYYGPLPEWFREHNVTLPPAHIAVQTDAMGPLVRAPSVQSTGQVDAGVQTDAMGPLAVRWLGPFHAWLLWDGWDRIHDLHSEEHDSAWYDDDSDRIAVECIQDLIFARWGRLFLRVVMAAPEFFSVEQLRVAMRNFAMPLQR